MHRIAVALLFLSIAAVAHAQSAPGQLTHDQSAAADAAIRAAMDAQTAAWNRADVPGFMQA